jgi:hypothetical protein
MIRFTNTLPQALPEVLVTDFDRLEDYWDDPREENEEE